MLHAALEDDLSRRVENPILRVYGVRHGGGLLPEWQRRRPAVRAYVLTTRAYALASQSPSRSAERRCRRRYNLGPRRPACCLEPASKRPDGIASVAAQSGCRRAAIRPPLEVSGDDSGAETIQRRIPSARVVKAMNTCGRETMEARGFATGSRRQSATRRADDGRAQGAAHRALGARR